MNLFYLIQDINLQKAVLLIAIVALIIASIVSIYKLKNKMSAVAQSWPPVVARCPDYWDVSGNYCVNLTRQNKGNPAYISTYASMSEEGNLYSTDGPTCLSKTCVIPIIQVDRKRWAKDNGFVWDGLTSDGSN